MFAQRHAVEAHAWLIDERRKAGFYMEETAEEECMMDAYYAGRDAFEEWLEKGGYV